MLILGMISCYCCYCRGVDDEDQASSTANTTELKLRLVQVELVNE